VHEVHIQTILNVLCCLLAIMLRDLIYSWHDSFVKWRQQRNLARREDEEDFREGDYCE
jgi:hypothetical protein